MKTSDVWKNLIDELFQKYPEHQRLVELKRDTKKMKRLKRWKKIKEMIEKYDV